MLYATGRQCMNFSWIGVRLLFQNNKQGGYNLTTNVESFS